MTNELKYVGDELTPEQIKEIYEDAVPIDQRLKITSEDVQWVITCAYAAGVAAGKRIQEANDTFVQDAMVDQHELDQRGVMKASVAVTMEAFVKRMNREGGEPGSIAAEIDIPIDQMATVYDRYNLESTLNNHMDTDEGPMIMSYKLIAK